jgi:4-hydroxy-2-oxoheptanedioate aldolase
MAARYGGWSMLPSPEAAEALGRTGFDFVGVDCQHGAHGFREAIKVVQLLDALGVEVLVRVSALELELIPRYLDFGAAGVIVAMVEDAATAAEAVALARYQPEGRRSYGGQRYGLHPEPGDVREVRPAVFAMIETSGALAAVSAIARTPGLAGLFVGPVDLALATTEDGGVVTQLSGAYARQPDLSENGSSPFPDAAIEIWRAAVDAIVTAAHAAGVEAGTFATGGDDAALWSDAGFDRVVIASDIALLRATLTRELGLARGASRSTTA